MPCRSQRETPNSTTGDPPLDTPTRRVSPGPMPIHSCFTATSSSNAMRMSATDTPLLSRLMVKFRTCSSSISGVIWGRATGGWA